MPWQVQLPVDERPPLGAGVGQEHPQLAVVDLAGGARVLALDPDRGRALLEEPGLIHHQHRARVAEVLDHIAAQVVPDQLRIPAGRGQQSLHPVRGALPGMLGQLPAVLATHVAYQPTQIRQHPPTRLGAGEPTADPGVQRLQPCRPRLYFLDLYCRLVDFRHVPRPPGARRCRRHPGRRAGTLPHDKCGWSIRSSAVTIPWRPRCLTRPFETGLSRLPERQPKTRAGSWRVSVPFTMTGTPRPAEATASCCSITASLLLSTPSLLPPST